MLWLSGTKQNKAGGQGMRKPSRKKWVCENHESVFDQEKLCLANNTNKTE